MTDIYKVYDYIEDLHCRDCKYSRVPWTVSKVMLALTGMIKLGDYRCTKFVWEKKRPVAYHNCAWSRFNIGMCGLHGKYWHPAKSTEENLYKLMMKD